MKCLYTDQQFEQAYLAHATIYARSKAGSRLPLIGTMEAFTPLFVRLAGQMLARDEYEFRVSQLRLYE
ncbi:hypothetical protein DUZ99_15475 [Xylanibacillus composti]|uniref:Uncharacterized protein n=1 Tax=Xylanibacillus composti TaxID=1572762 RepID=A0A8J4H3N9_9BACL|nr:hypothetical protein [Xylanibacillus composti]MDT9726383.1 hypothetical protein [Xylanibacillus composti]GIQ70378.1 hypothetical protein XYCOK13_32020 [Xylanibacillus composti]